MDCDRYISPEDEEEEQRHFANIIAALKYYRAYSYARVNKNEASLNSMSSAHQQMLTKYRNQLHKIRECIDENYRVIQKMLQDGDHFDQLFGGNSAARHEDHAATKIRHQDLENVQTTLKQFVRDWSTEGEEERRQSYKPIIDAIENHFDPSNLQPNDVKILVPGAGLGRLAYELARRGYSCEGNEFSYFMLIASNFVLNQCEEEHQYTLYPWVHHYVNNLSRKDQVSPVSFPDVCPIKQPPTGEFKMIAGDFLQVYIDPEVYDCVATCFFIDCAHNIVEFIETIYRILKPEGLWVNLGPLLYHYSDVQNESSIEPTFEDLITIIETVGFEFVEKTTGVRTKYAQNPRSMVKSEYESLFWVARKPKQDCPTPPHEDTAMRILSTNGHCRATYIEDHTDK